jgi:diadenosine tetraphosphate (Ap4A) HIT family hydrolase
MTGCGVLRIVGMDACVFCERSALRAADTYIENDHCVYASSRDPRDPPEVLPGSGIIVPKAHRPSPFDLEPSEWMAVRELLLEAKSIQDAALSPDGYFLSWTSFPETDAEVDAMHAHLHVVPRFDDEPMRHGGGRVGIKGADNIRPDPARPGNGRARLFGHPTRCDRLAGGPDGSALRGENPTAMAWMPSGFAVIGDV